MNEQPIALLPKQDQDAIVIGELYRKGREAITDSMKYLAEAGRRLIAKKESLQHGQWLPWLKVNAEALGMNVISTPQRLMQHARKFCVDAEFQDPAKALQASRDIWGNTNLRGTQGTGENEWFTPAEYIELARAVLGEIDLDPASHEQAQETVRAARYFTKEQDGLSQEWHGRIWLNPPYAQPIMPQFISKMVAERVAGRVTAAIMLTHNYTDTAWFHEAVTVADAICFTRGRVKFCQLERGVVAVPTQGQAFFYFGSDMETFADQFQSIGFIVKPIWTKNSERQSNGQWGASGKSSNLAFTADLE